MGTSHRRARLSALTLTLASQLALAGGALAATDTPFTRIADLYDAAALPDLADASVDATWAGKCAIADSPRSLNGALEHFFVAADPILGNRAWAVETVRRGDETWPTRSTQSELEAARTEAQSGRRYFSELTATETSLATRFVQRGPGVVVDNVNELRRGTTEDGAPLWLMRVSCNLPRCQSFGGGGPILTRGDAIAYCYFNQRVLPVE